MKKSITICLFVALLLLPFFSSAQYDVYKGQYYSIATVAGVPGSIGYSGDGGSATSAQLNSPYCCVDTAGNIFIADQLNNRIRKIAASTGIITTICGNGTAGHSGDGGAASLALVTNPGAIKIGKTGNLFFVDGFSIRKIDAASGKISTVAGISTSFGFSGDGGLATAAQFSDIYDFAVDSVDDIYVSDFDNQRIRKITAATGVVNTIAGNGTAGYTGDGGAATAAEIYDPIGICLDKAGNLYFTPSINSVIRRIVLSTGVISTLSPRSYWPLYGNPNCLVSDDAGNLYLSFMHGLSSVDTRQILRIDALTDSLLLIAGRTDTFVFNNHHFAAETRFEQPQSICLDKKGNIYFSEVNISSGTSTIRKLSIAPQPKSHVYNISTIAGNGSYGYSGDGGPATSAELSDCRDFCLDKAGNIYITDYAHNVVRKIDAKTKIITTIAGTGTAGYSGDGGAATSATLNRPWAIDVDATGNIYFSETGNNLIRKVNTSGIISTAINTGAGAKVLGLASDALGNIYFSKYDSVYYYDSNTVNKWNPSTGIVNLFAGSGIGYGDYGDGGPATSAFLYYPGAVQIDAAGNVYITAYGNGTIRKVDASIHHITTVAGNYYVFSTVRADSTPKYLVQIRPTKVFARSNGEILCNAGDGTVRLVDTSGWMTIIAGGGTTLGDGGLAKKARIGVGTIRVDDSGYIYIMDTVNNRIRKLTDTSMHISHVGVGYVSNSSPAVDIFPNPSNGQFTIQFGELQPACEIEVFDATGKKVFATTTQQTKTIIDLGKNPAGVYFVSLQYGGKQMVKKLILTN